MRPDREEGNSAMKINHQIGKSLLAALVIVFSFGCAANQHVLPSWNDGPAKKSIEEFVAAVKDKSGSDYVEPAERIAVFDNDGTLWLEQPIYTQLAFAIDRVKALAPQHPEWKTKQPFKAVLEGDHAALAASGMKGIAEIVMATHAGMTTDEFEEIVVGWLAAATHPKYQRPYTELTYQPMLELLAYLRENGFKTYIVSGGGVEFMRPFTAEVYGIPPEQVVGSMTETRFELRDGTPVLVKEPKLFFIDDKEGKPIGIQKFIGHQPILAAGNSDGDMQMLQWTTAGDGRRLGLIVHHDDAEREYAYDRESKIGTLNNALDAAGPAGWVVISMENDWKQVFP
jgi:phosphoglycolate phosphatase-like HAD superfamily hydrolase